MAKEKRKLKSFTYKKHRHTGIALHHIRNYLLSLSCDLANSYGKSSKKAARARTAYNLVNQLRCVLEEDMAQEGMDFAYAYYALLHGSPPLETPAPFRMDLCGEG